MEATDVCVQNVIFKLLCSGSRRVSEQTPRRRRMERRRMDVAVVAFLWSDSWQLQGGGAYGCGVRVRNGRMGTWMASMKQISSKIPSKRMNFNHNICCFVLGFFVVIHTCAQLWQTEWNFSCNHFQCRWHACFDWDCTLKNLITLGTTYESGWNFDWGRSDSIWSVLFTHWDLGHLSPLGSLDDTQATELWHPWCFMAESLKKISTDYKAGLQSLKSLNLLINIYTVSHRGGAVYWLSSQVWSGHMHKAEWRRSSHRDDTQYISKSVIFLLYNSLKSLLSPCWQSRWQKLSISLWFSMRPPITSDWRLLYSVSTWTPY